MYEGNNPIALQSKSWLVDALFKLLETTPYEKITIRSLCAQADLSRQTFYNIFQSKDEILTYYIDQLDNNLFREHLFGESLPLDRVILEFLNGAERNSERMKLLVHRGLEGFILKPLSWRLSRFSTFVDNGEDTLITPYAAAFLSGALLQLLVVWYKRDDHISKEELARTLADTITRTYICALSA